jgi:hypothetical protein
MNRNFNFLKESHERAVLQAIHEATDAVIAHRRQQEKIENETINKRLERIENQFSRIEEKIDSILNKK